MWLLVASSPGIRQWLLETPTPKNLLCQAPRDPKDSQGHLALGSSSELLRLRPRRRPKLPAPLENQRSWLPWLLMVFWGFLAPPEEEPRGPRRPDVFWLKLSAISPRATVQESVRFHTWTKHPEFCDFQEMPGESWGGQSKIVKRCSV